MDIVYIADSEELLEDAAWKAMKGKCNILFFGNSLFEVGKEDNYYVALIKRLDYNSELI